MSQNKRPPVTVNIPPKKSGKHKPTRQELQNRFVNYWSNHGYGNLKSMWGDIQDIAQNRHLDPVYLAAYLMTHGGIGTDYAHIAAVATSESSRLNRTGGRDKATQQFTLRTPNFKNYSYTMGGTWGGSETAAEGKAALKPGNKVMFSDRYGNPVSVYAYQQEVAGLNDLFQKYLGRNVTRREAINIIKNQWSGYKVETYLSKLPGFTKGQVWKSQAPLLVNDWETVYGVDKTLRPPKDLIRQAILRGAGGSAWFQDQIRKLPQYKKSVEYKQIFAGFSQTYSQIYGQVDDSGRKLIDDAIMGRMSGEQFQSMLRQRPEYANSFQMQGVWQGMGDMLGSIFGRPASAQQGQAGQGGNLAPASPGQAGQGGNMTPPPEQPPPRQPPVMTQGRRPRRPLNPANARSGV